jgi:hypothetical protein
MMLVRLGGILQSKEECAQVTSRQNRFLTVVPKKDRHIKKIFEMIQKKKFENGSGHRFPQILIGNEPAF